MGGWLSTPELIGQGPHKGVTPPLRRVPQITGKLGPHHWGNLSDVSASLYGYSRMARTTSLYGRGRMVGNASLYGCNRMARRQRIILINATSSTINMDCIIVILMNPVI